MKYLLLLHGMFYTLTGLLAIVSLRWFFILTQNSNDPFKTHSNAVLFFALGLFYIYSAFREELVRPIANLAGGIALLVAIVDGVYLVRHGTSGVFLLDCIEEFFVATLMATLLYSRH